MGVPHQIIKTVTVNGAGPHRVFIPAPARGVLIRIGIIEDAGDHGVVKLDVYNNTVLTTGAESARAPYRVCRRLTSTNNVVDEKLDAYGQSDFLSHVPYALYPTEGKVARDFCCLITTAGAGDRTFTIIMTVVTPVLM